MSLRSYSPKVGYTVGDPFSGGMSQNEDNPTGRKIQVRWTYTHEELTRDQAIKLVGEIPHNKSAIVYSVGDRYVEAVYHHNLTYVVIRTSYRDLVPDFGRGVKMHDTPYAQHPELGKGRQCVDLVACDKADRARQLSASAVQLLNHEGYLVEATEPIAAKPRYGRPTDPTVFVPTAKITTAEGTFTGKIALNFCGEPLGIWTGEKLV
jgi:hypothetical protein